MYYIIILLIDFSNIYGEEMYDHRLDAAEAINLVDWPEFDDIRLWLRDKLIKAFNK